MDENQTLDHDRIMKINIEEEMKSSYIDYSMSVIVARALPDVRDGFKPVHRRILYGMLGIGNTSDKPYPCAFSTGADSESLYSDLYSDLPTVFGLENGAGCIDYPADWYVVL